MFGGPFFPIYDPSFKKFYVRKFILIKVDLEKSIKDLKTPLETIKGEVDVISELF